MALEWRKSKQSLTQTTVMTTVPTLNEERKEEKRKEEKKELGKGRSHSHILIKAPRGSSNSPNNNKEAIAISDHTMHHSPLTKNVMIPPTGVAEAHRALNKELGLVSTRSHAFEKRDLITLSHEARVKDFKSVSSTERQGMKSPMMIRASEFERMKDQKRPDGIHDPDPKQILMDAKARKVREAYPQMCGEHLDSSGSPAATSLLTPNKSWSPERFKTDEDSFRLDLSMRERQLAQIKKGILKFERVKTEQLEEGKRDIILSHVEAGLEPWIQTQLHMDAVYVWEEEMRPETHDTENKFIKANVVIKEALASAEKKIREDRVSSGEAAAERFSLLKDVRTLAFKLAIASAERYSAQVAKQEKEAIMLYHSKQVTLTLTLTLIGGHYALSFQAETNSIPR